MQKTLRLHSITPQELTLFLDRDNAFNYLIFHLSGSTLFHFWLHSVKTSKRETRNFFGFFATWLMCHVDVSLKKYD